MQHNIVKMKELPKETRLLQIHFNDLLDNLLESRAELYKERERFTNHFNQGKLQNLELKDYALGKANYKETFCYNLEFTLDSLGSMGASPSTKFGIYYGKYKGKEGTKYWFTERYGKTQDEAFSKIKSELNKLYVAGLNGDLESIKSNMLAPNFRAKILSTYFPEKYLPIFSNAHLSHYLVQFNLDTPEILKSDVYEKRRILLDFKNEDPIMKSWTNDIFSYFLYTIYPKAPGKEQSKDSIADFPINQSLINVNLQLIEFERKKKRNTKSNSSKNPDYIKLAENNKIIGNRGEKLVIEHEKEKLRKVNLEGLASKVKKVEYDWIGYDIDSFDIEGNPISIEVKSTTNKIGLTNFHISSNELEKAHNIPNYRLYIVYDIKSEHPQVWNAGNLITNENDKIEIRPSNYIITLKTKYDA